MKKDKTIFDEIAEAKRLDNMKEKLRQKQLKQAKKEMNRSKDRENLKKNQ